jgi:methylthioribose-1-phosphate isomerase
MWAITVTYEAYDDWDDADLVDVVDDRPLKTSTRLFSTKAMAISWLHGLLSAGAVIHKIKIRRASLVAVTAAKAQATAERKARRRNRPARKVETKAEEKRREARDRQRKSRVARKRK